jgi:hypothetical protein
MKSKKIIMLVLFSFTLSTFIFAQEQTKQKIEFPQYTLEQKYERAEGNFVSHTLAGIAYAKSKGDTPDDYGKFIGELHGRGWQAGERNPIEYFVSGMNFNMNLFNDFQMEILEQSDSSIKARMNRKWENQIKKQAEYGVTLDEFHNWLVHLWKAITNHLGLEYKQEFESDWITFTVIKKK